MPIVCETVSNTYQFQCIMTYDTINDVVTMTGGEGTLLAGRYRIVRQLGTGGMGSVWLAEDTQLDNKPFAIKMLPSILVSNKRAYRQLKDEALVAMRLVHPNIVQIRAFEENNGNPFLVMDYIDGQTLDDYLAEHGGDNLTQSRGGAESQGDLKGGSGCGLPEEDVVRILKPIAAALDYAHGEGVVHRDVKPANVMIRKDGHPFILDFGIAREIQETMTRVTGKLSSGTLLYMSPEQLMGEQPKPAQDIYSFAAMVYECLKGEPPFSHGQIEFQIMNKLPESLVGRDVSVAPPSIARSVMAGLAKKPEDRPPTCVAVLEGDDLTQRCGEAEAQSGMVGCPRPADGRGVSMNPPPVPSNRPLGEEDAARARVDAKMLQRRIERLPDEDGFAERKSALAESFVRAEMLFESRLWGDAMREFTEYVRQCEELEKRDAEIREQRRREAEAKTEAERRRREAEAERKRREAEAKVEAERRRREAEEMRLGPPSGTTRTIILPGGVEIRLRWCRSGTFMMGSPELENGHCYDERQHEVTLTKGFWLGETPVTQRQWQSVMKSSPSHFKGADLPVECVSWDDCQKFIQKVNEQLDCGARLPTEAEWEYACRAGTMDVHYGAGNLDEIGWYGNTFFGFGRTTYPVAQKKPNAWGLYDMIGNVWEWCSDWYGDYPHGSITDPTGPSLDAYRVSRGGSWLSLARYCRPAYRGRDSPDNRSYSLGFRVAFAPGL